MSQTDQQTNEDYDTVTIDDLSIDTHVSGFKPQERVDLDVLKQRRYHNKATCMYCRRRDICGNGIFSIMAKNKVADKSEPPVWFCSESCSSMYKHETGIIQMPNEQFQDILKRCYPAMYSKRYSV
jgi:hypothetical protein